MKKATSNMHDEIKKGASLVAALLAAAGVSSCAHAPANESIARTGPVYVNAKTTPPLGSYSSAVRVGDLVFISGVLAFDHDTKSFAAPEIGAQTRKAFDNLEAALTAAGTGLDDVVKISVYLRDAADIAAMNAIYEERVIGGRPARTLVSGADWGREEILIEIDAIAYCGHCE
ncbi:MAG: RidA family protein [Parvularculaceae bacterium]